MMMGEECVCFKKKNYVRKTNYKCDVEKREMVGNPQ